MNSSAQVVWTLLWFFFFYPLFGVSIIKMSPLDILHYIFSCDLKYEGEIPFESLNPSKV